MSNEAHAAAYARARTAHTAPRGAVAADTGEKTYASVQELQNAARNTMHPVSGIVNGKRMRVDLSGKAVAADAEPKGDIVAHLKRYHYTEVASVGSSTALKGQGGDLITVAGNGDWSVTGVSGKTTGRGNGLASLRAR